MWLSVHPEKGRTLRGDVSAGKAPKKYISGTLQRSHFEKVFGVDQSVTMSDREGIPMDYSVCHQIFIDHHAAMTWICRPSPLTKTPLL